jgi:hypothetical protein
MWVPDIFPHDILEIHEQHVIDTDEVWVRFRLGETSFRPSDYGYEPIEREALQLPFRSPARTPWKRGWWPESFPEGFRFFEGSHLGDAAFIAIGRDGNVFWWRRAA